MCDSVCGCFYTQTEGECVCMYAQGETWVYGQCMYHIVGGRGVPGFAMGAGVVTFVGFLGVPRCQGHRKL